MADRLEATISMVEKWEPSDEHGVSSKESTLEFLTYVDDAIAFDREHGDQHITGSAVVVSRAGVLLHKHKLSQMWMGPGGHVDAGESAGEAAVRETFEETGVRATHLPTPCLLRVDTHVTTNKHTHHDLCFLLRSEPDVITPGEGESPEAGWFGFDTAAELAAGTFGLAIPQARTHLEVSG